MKKQIIKSLLFILTIGMFVSCTDNISKKLEDRLNELDSKAASLDSLVNTELDRVKNLDSLINFESDEIKELDSIITKSSSRIDSVADKKIELLKEIIK